jgi:hypothetical protein
VGHCQCCHFLGTLPPSPPLLDAFVNIFNHLTGMRVHQVMYVPLSWGRQCRRADGATKTKRSRIQKQQRDYTSMTTAVTTATATGPQTAGEHGQSPKTSQIPRRRHLTFAQFRDVSEGLPACQVAGCRACSTPLSPYCLQLSPS